MHVPWLLVATFLVWSLHLPTSASGVAPQAASRAAASSGPPQAGEKGRAAPARTRDARSRAKAGRRAPFSECRTSNGYWGTHTLFGPAERDDGWDTVGELTLFFKSGTTWVGAIKSEVKGEPYFQLAQKWIAAVLTATNHPDLVTPALREAIAEGEALFTLFTPDQAQAARREFVKLAGRLARLNVRGCR